MTQDLRNLAKVHMDYASLAGPYGSGPGLLRKLTWRGIPEQRPDGSWVEIWHAHVSGLIDPTDRGGRGLFTAELRECFGRDHTAILRDRVGRELGHFLTLTGAQNRARRHFQGRA